MKLKEEKNMWCECGRWRSLWVEKELRDKKLNNGYKVEQIAGKVDYFVFYVDRSSLISVPPFTVLTPNHRTAKTPIHPLLNQSYRFFHSIPWNFSDRSQSNTFFVF